jgi:hypothetical protein
MSLTSVPQAVTAGVLVAALLVIAAALLIAAVLYWHTKPVIGTRPARPEFLANVDTQVLEAPNLPEQTTARYRPRHSAGADRD